jgi:hypothetical protein
MKLKFKLKWAILKARITGRFDLTLSLDEYEELKRRAIDAGMAQLIMRIEDPANYEEAAR